MQRNIAKHEGNVNEKYSEIYLGPITMENDKEFPHKFLTYLSSDTPTSSYEYTSRENLKTLEVINIVPCLLQHCLYCL